MAELTLSPSEELEGMKTELLSDDFASKPDLERTQFKRSYATLALYNNPFFDSREFDDDEKDEMIRELEIKFAKKHPDKFSSNYEGKVTPNVFWEGIKGALPGGGLGDVFKNIFTEGDLGVTEKETKTRLLRTSFEENSMQALDDMSFEELDRIDSKKLLQLRDDMSIEDAHPDLYKRMTAIGKARSGNLTDVEAATLALARGIVPLFATIKKLSKEELASLYLGHGKFEAQQTGGAIGSLVTGGLAVQAYRRSLGITTLAKKLSFVAAGDGILGVAYKDVAPGYLADLAGKPDDWRLNFIEAAGLSTLVEGASALRYMSKWAKENGMTLGEFRKLHKTMKKTIDEVRDFDTFLGKKRHPSPEGRKAEGLDIPSGTQGEVVAKGAEYPGEVAAKGVEDPEVEALSLNNQLIELLPANMQEAATKGVKKFKQAMKNWFTKEGPMTDEMAEAKYARTSHLSADFNKIIDAKEHLLGTIEIKYGKSWEDFDPAIRKKINDILSIKEENPSGLMGAPYNAGELVEPVARMREVIDTFTEEIGKLDFIDEELKLILDANKGAYLYLSYKSYTRPNWAKELKATPEGRRHIKNARTFLQKENPEMGDDELDAMIDRFIKPKESGANSFYDSFSVMTKDHKQIFIERQNIPEQLLAIMGPEDDAIINYLMTAHQQATFLQSQKMLEQIKNDHLGKVLFKTIDPIHNTRVGVGAEKLDYTNPLNARLRPLSELYTTPELAEVIQNIDRVKFSGNALYDLYAYTILGPKVVAQISKTALNPGTHVRNFVGGGLNVLANGNLFRPLRTTVKGKQEGFKNAWDTVWTNISQADDEARQAITRDYQRRGIIGTNADLGDIKAAMEGWGDSSYQNEILKTNLKFTKVMGVKVPISGKAVAKAKRWTLGTYQAEDDFWKIYNYEAEKQAYKEIYQNDELLLKHGVKRWTDDQIETHAAKLTRDHMPNYREVSEAIKFWRKMPFGNFISFPAEIFRTSGHIMHQGWKEMQEPITRAIGARRLASFAAFGLGASAAAAGVTRQLTNTSKVQDYDFRRFVPHWSENSNLQYISRSKDGVIKYLDFSYTDPYEYLQKPFFALLRNLGETDTEKVGTDVMEGFSDAIRDFATPFIEPSMWIKPIGETYINRKLDNLKPAGAVFNEADSFGDKFWEGFKHIFGDLEPGAMTGGRRISGAARGKATKEGKPYDFMTEMFGFLGLRASTIDIKESLKHRGYRNQGGISESRRIFTSKARDGSGTVTPQELIETLHKSQVARFNYFQEAYRDMEAAASNGVSRRKTARIFRDQSNMSKKDVRAISLGAFRPYTPSKDTFRQMRESGHERSLSELSVIIHGLKMVQSNWNRIPLNPDPGREEFIPDSP